LFGGQAVAAVASSYQLTGVVAAGRDSAAILVADGQPPQALKLGKEIASGVTVKEVHPKYVMLSEGGCSSASSWPPTPRPGRAAPSRRRPAQPSAPPGNEITGGGRPGGPVEPQQPPPPPQQPQMPPPTRVNQPPAE
jgi:general secretion pathway protein C